MNSARGKIIALFIFLLIFVCLTTPPTVIYSQDRNEGRININTATIEELQRLPGVGQAIASRIIEHRQKHGSFRRPQDIIIVRGMSAKLYRRIAHLIRV